MLTHTYLFAYNAKYHRCCYSHYIIERKVSAAHRKTRDTEHDEASVHDDTSMVIVSELEQIVFSTDMSVSSLPDAKTKYVKAHTWIMKIEGHNSTYYGAQLVFVEVTQLDET